MTNELIEAGASETCGCANCTCDPCNCAGAGVCACKKSDDEA